MSIRAGKPEAAAVIWAPDAAGRRNLGEAVRSARKRGLTRSAMSLVAGAGLTYIGWKFAGAFAMALGALTLVAVLASPLGAYGRLERAGAEIARLVSAAMTWLVMTSVYLLFFTPFGRATRHGKRDPLQRGFDPQAPSYWIDRPPTKRDYERQF